MTDKAAMSDVGGIVKAKRDVLLAAFRFIDGEAGVLNGIPNEPGKAVDAPDVIAMELADVFGVPFDENWPEYLVAAVMKEKALSCAAGDPLMGRG